MAEGLLHHLHGGEGVVLHLEQGHVELLGAVEQLRQGLADAGEDQALGGRLQRGQRGQESYGC
mgnify:CR=1 FL=1